MTASASCLHHLRLGAGAPSCAAAPGAKPSRPTATARDPPVAAPRLASCARDEANRPAGPSALHCPFPYRLPAASWLLRSCLLGLGCSHTESYSFPILPPTGGWDQQESPSLPWLEHAGVSGCGSEFFLSMPLPLLLLLPAVYWLCPSLSSTWALVSCTDLDAICILVLCQPRCNLMISIGAHRCQHRCCGWLLNFSIILRLVALLKYTATVVISYEIGLTVVLACTRHTSQLEKYTYANIVTGFI